MTRVLVHVAERHERDGVDPSHHAYTHQRPAHSSRRGRRSDHAVLPAVCRLLLLPHCAIALLRSVMTVISTVMTVNKIVISPSHDSHRNSH